MNWYCLCKVGLIPRGIRRQFKYSPSFALILTRSIPFYGISFSLYLSVLIAYRQQAVTETLIAAYQRVVTGRPGTGLAPGPGLASGSGLAPGSASGQGLTVVTLQLPSEWSLQTDPTTSKTFYANNLTNTSSWDLPAGAGMDVQYLLPLRYNSNMLHHLCIPFQYISHPYNMSLQKSLLLQYSLPPSSL